MNECPEHELNEERFRRIEENLNSLSNMVDKNNQNACENIKKIEEYINEFKEDYIATKNNAFKTIDELKGVTGALNNLEKALINMNNSILNNDTKIDLVNDKITAIEKKIEKNDEKGKFDIIGFLKSLIPSLLTGGIVYFILTILHEGGIR